MKEIGLRPRPTPPRRARFGGHRSVAVLSLLAALGAFEPALPQDSPRPRLVEDAALALTIQPLIVVGGQSGALASRRLVVDPDRGGELELELQWPVPERSSRIRLRASGRPGPAGGEHRLSVRVDLTFPDGRTVRALREIVATDGAATLFEVYREGDQGLTLALTVERKVRSFRIAERRPGDPVAFELEVHRVRGEDAVRLETNTLTTFVGEPVEYSFERGAGPTAESIKLLLTPSRRREEFLQVTVEVAGQLPGEDGRLFVDRRESVWTSRGATSTVVVTGGDPPTGYRFRLTPDF